MIARDTGTDFGIGLDDAELILGTLRHDGVGAPMGAQQQTDRAYRCHSRRRAKPLP